MLRNNKIIILLLAVCLSFFALSLAVKFKHQIKKFTLKQAVNVEHIINKRTEPVRYVPAVRTSPVIFYSDLTAGPNTGGQDNNGVFVTIWGNGFGSSQGSSYITVGGGQANNYPTWTNTMICFQLGPNASIGNIVLVTPNGTAAGPLFGVQSGNVYFVNPQAPANGSGAYDNPFNHLASFESIAAPGDTVYVREGTIYDEVDGNEGWHSMMAPTVAGTQGSPVSWIAYPNESVILKIDGGSQTWPSNGSDHINYIFRGYSPWQTVSKFKMELTGNGGQSAVESTGSDGWKVVGNNITASSYIYAIVGLAGNYSSVLGNEIHHSGNDTFNNMNHSIYWDGGGNNVDIGWNYLHDNRNTGWEISCFHQGTRVGKIHDNLITNTGGNILKGILLGDVDSGEDKTTVEGQNIQVYNNILYNLGYDEYGGAIQAVSGTAYIDNNTIYQSPESKGTIQFPAGGVGPGGGSPVWYLANNIIYNSRSNSLYLSDGNGNDPSWSNFTLLTNNNYFGAGKGPSADQKPVNADPQFVSNGTDLHLKASSPDINAGYYTNDIVSEDFDGRLRSNTPTIGSYEFSGNLPITTSPQAGPTLAEQFRHQIKNLVTGRNDPIRYNATIPAGSNDGVSIFTASSLDRIFQDGKTLLKPAFGQAGSVSLAKNEYTSFQVVVSSQDREINDVELKISDLVNAKTGSRINKENISARIVGYVPTIKPYYPVKYVGNWPDPLLPDQKANIKKGVTQPFWITIYSPPDTVAGDYGGNITVTMDNKTIKTIPLSVHVYNFQLPKASHLKTAFDFFDKYTAMRYPRGEAENAGAYKARIEDINDAYIIMMLKYRMDPILNIDPSSQMEMANMDRYMVYGLNNFAVGKRGGSFNNNWPKDDKSIEDLFNIYRTYGEDLKLYGMLPNAYVYLWDEGEMGNPEVAKIASMIHRAYPGLKNMVDYHGIWDTANGSDWIKDIDIWTFNIDEFNEQKLRQLQALGKETWMYISGPSGNNDPNMAIDFDSIDYRIIPWLCWKYDIKGFLYWSVNYWPNVDPFKNAQNTKWDQNGNGLLLYPGKDGPIGSLRMEIFRDGMEDYEYIQLLFDDLKTLKSKDLDKKYPDYFKESVRLLTMDDSIITSMSNFTKDGELLNARRDAIARKIEEFSSLP